MTDPVTAAFWNREGGKSALGLFRVDGLWFQVVTCT